MKYSPGSPVFNEKTHDKQTSSVTTKKTEPAKYQPKRSTRPTLKAEPKESEVSRIPVSRKLSPTSALRKLTATRREDKQTSPTVVDVELSKPSRVSVPSRLESTIKSAGTTSGTSSNRNTPKDRKDSALSDNKLDVDDVIINDQSLIDHHSDSFRLITIASRGMVHPYRRIYSPMFDETSSEDTVQSVSQDNDKVFFRKSFSGFQTKSFSDTVLNADNKECETFTLNQKPKLNCFPVLIVQDNSSDLGNVEELQDSEVTPAKKIEKSWLARFFNLDKWKTWKTLYTVSISSLLVHLILYSDEYLLSFPIYIPYGWQYSDVL